MNIKLNGSFSIKEDVFSFKDLEIDITEGEDEFKEIEDVLADLFGDDVEIEFLEESDIDLMGLGEISVDECEHCMFGGIEEEDINFELMQTLVEWYAGQIRGATNEASIKTLLEGFAYEVLDI